VGNKALLIMLLVTVINNIIMDCGKQTVPSVAVIDLLVMKAH